MLIRNSLKQIFRTPVRTAMFFVLLLLSTVLLATGINLWQVSLKGIKEFESIFHTVGTVRQKESGTVINEKWDAETKSASYYRQMTYGKWVDPDVLDFEGANYAVKPRKRPYFGALVPNYRLAPEQEEEAKLYKDWLTVVEVKALSGGTADPLEVQVTNKFNGNEELTGHKIKICDHNNPEPIILEEGKTYIMRLNGSFPGHGFREETLGYTYEYYITGGIESTQRTIDGALLSETDEEDEFNEVNRFDEVTKGFYETSRGKTWMAVAKEQELFNMTLPVQPVDKTILLKAFYNKTADIVSGRDITDQEYEEGRDVCLIPQKLADYNKWQVGDSIELPLYFANYANAPVSNFGWEGGIGIRYTLLNAKGKSYQVFNKNTYEIVGLYDVKGNPDDSVEGISPNQVIIPFNSVENSWEDNIADNKPMKHDTTSFEIPNGEIDSFMEAWKKLGNDLLEIKFYDKGYTQLQEGIENRQVMAYIFLTGGGIMTLLVILFFCHLFILKQEQRTAIERSMGMSAKHCTASLLFGLLLIVLLGAAAGGAAGFQVSKKVLADMKIETYYDDTFTNGYVQNEEETQKDGDIINRQGEPMRGSAAAGILVVTASGVIAGFYMKKQLKKEPLSLLSRAEE